METTLRDAFLAAVESGDDDAIDAAKAALLNSDEQIEYSLIDGESGVSETVMCATDKEARAAAHDWANDGAYLDDLETTIWVEVRIARETDAGYTVGAGGSRSHEEESITVQIDPEEPACTESAHDWQSPIELVGGIAENPGVWGHGGGVKINEACIHCGCGKTTDTWAQNPTNGEQGLTSVTYERDRYDLSDMQEVV